MTRRLEHRRGWHVQLRFADRVREDRFVDDGEELTVGRGGCLVVPGLQGVFPLIRGGHRCDVPGLKIATAQDDGVSQRLVSESQPDVVVELHRREQPRASSRRGMFRVPAREALYGASVALCLASLVAVDVAVSPVAAAETEPALVDGLSELPELPELPAGDELDHLADGANGPLDVWHLRVGWHQLGERFLERFAPTM